MILFTNTQGELAVTYERGFYKTHELRARGYTQVGFIQGDLDSISSILNRTHDLTTAHKLKVFLSQTPLTGDALMAHKIKLAVDMALSKYIKDNQWDD